MLFWLLFSWLTVSAADVQSYAGLGEMNGVRFSDYQNFSEKWVLVTIRFRKDTGEMRMTYANDIAFKTLSSGAINYPDGAVFAKIGFHTNSDPQFESSVVPQSIRRYQFMLRDQKKYASTGGWGYGLFDPQGKTFPEEPKAAQDACYACHAIISERGQVFSQPFAMVGHLKIKNAAAPNMGSAIKFEWQKKADLPKALQEQLTSAEVKVRFVTNKLLRKNVFQGTLDEMRPVLESEARKSQAPALFLAQDQKRFVLVRSTKKTECMGEGAMEVISTDIKFVAKKESYCTHD